MRVPGFKVTWSGLQQVFSTPLRHIGAPLGFYKTVSFIGTWGLAIQLGCLDIRPGVFISWMLKLQVELVLGGCWETHSGPQAWAISTLMNWTILNPQLTFDLMSKQHRIALWTFLFCSYQDERIWDPASSIICYHQNLGHQGNALENTVSLGSVPLPSQVSGTWLLTEKRWRCVEGQTPLGDCQGKPPTQTSTEPKCAQGVTWRSAERFCVSQHGGAGPAATWIRWLLTHR